MSSSSTGVKRKTASETQTKPPCKYGKECYRRNPYHMQEFSHPDTDTDKQARAGKKVKLDKKVKINKDRKLCLNRNPILFTTVKGIDDAFNARGIAIDIKDILEDNCGTLESSVQFNFMFEIPWLVSQYPKCAKERPLLLVHGRSGAEKSALEAEAMRYNHVDLVQAILPIPYGCHHTKMMFLSYCDRFRVVITTANLIEKDWFQKTQGVWISPMFKKVGASYQEEADLFKRDLIDYVSAYNSTKLLDWITKINEFDMSQANVHLVASVPGRHNGAAINKWGHLKLRHLLSTYGPEKSVVTKDWPVVGQFSSIGSLGDDGDKWLCSEWLRSLSCCHGDKVMQNKGNCGNVLQLIYPTINNVKGSLEGYSAGGSLPYGVQLAMKQRYLKEHLCQWVASDIGRSLAMPHIKSYTRLSPDCLKAAWFLLTSANLSKAAWGVYEKNETQFAIRSYEMGVLLLPKKDQENNPLFSLKPSQCSSSNEETISLPYDVPLRSYGPNDKPWVWDIKHTTEDSHGKLWIPR